MTLNTEEISEAPVKPAKAKRQPIAWNFAWIPGIFIKPRSTLKKVIAAEKPVWLTPLLLISVLVVISALVAAPIRTQIAQAGNGEVPDGFQWWSDADQAKYFESQNNKVGPMFMIVFPLLKGITGYWVLWFVFAAIWHLILTLTGSRVARVKVSNVVAWAMLPLVLRVLVQIINTLVTRTLGAPTGLSTWVAADATGFLSFIRFVLAGMDAYWLWFAILCLVAAAPLSQLKPAKAFWATLICVVLVLILSAVPGLINSWLGKAAGNASF